MADLPTQPALGREHRPMVELLMLAAPTVAQMASYTLLQFTDRYMLALVGDLEAAAAGTAGLVMFCLIGFGFGTLLVINTLASQSFGRGDHPSAGRYMWQGLWFGITMGLLAMVLLPWSEALFRLSGHEPAMARLEGDYLRVVLLGTPIKLAAAALSQFLLGIHRPLIVFIGTACGVVINIFCNWLLIYGNWGFPAMGVAGSAWGTNVAVLVELAIMAMYVARPVLVREFHTGDWRLRWDLMRTLLRVGLPAGFQLICDVLAWTVFLTVIVAQFGTAALAANSFAFTYMHVSFMPAVGVGAAVTALVGKYIGRGRPDLAQRRAHMGFVFSVIYMAICGLAFYLFRWQLMGIFSDDPQVLKIGALMMIFVALYQVFDAMFIVYVGALRGAGDTLVPAVTQGALVWSIVVGGGALAVQFAPQWGVSGPWTLATIFGAILGFYMLARFQKGHWKNIVLHHPATTDVPTPATETTR